MSTEWVEFEDEHQPEIKLRVESGCSGIKIEIERVPPPDHGSYFAKFFVRSEDVERFKQALDQAKERV